MFIQRLMIQNFRNLSCVELETEPGFNLICGPNGAGKTSVLEAINYLALGRSFRQSSNQYLIQQGQPTLSIYAQIQEDLNAHAVQTTIGMSRTRGDELTIKVNSDPLFRLIDLIDHICVQVIHPQGIELVTKESEGRRSFIDWGVYYSDESFKQLWWDYRKALKQRNALLRSNKVRYKPRVQRYVDSYYNQDASIDNQNTNIEQGDVGASGLHSSAYPYTSSSHQQASSSSFDSRDNANHNVPYRGNAQSTFQLKDSFKIQELSPVLQARLRPEYEGQGSYYQGSQGSSLMPQGAMSQGMGMGAINDEMPNKEKMQSAETAYQVQGQLSSQNDQGTQDQGSATQSVDSDFQSIDSTSGLLMLGGQPSGNDQDEQRRGLNRLWSSPLSEFEIWNEQIADLSEKITARRLNYLEDLVLVLQEILDQFLPNFKLKFELYFGWDKGSDLRGQLAQNLEKERGLGYTLYGCHRADLKIKNHNLAAGATLSRGQLKMLVYAMRLAQGILLKQQTQRSCIYLIDDLNSELDDDSQRRLLNTLLECQHQVFISNIQSDFRNNLIPQGRTDIKVFNLDQGRLVD